MSYKLDENIKNIPIKNKVSASRLLPNLVMLVYRALCNLRISQVPKRK